MFASFDIRWIDVNGNDAADTVTVPINGHDTIIRKAANPNLNVDEFWENIITKLGALFECSHIGSNAMALNEKNIPSRNVQKESELIEALRAFSTKLSNNLKVEATRIFGHHLTHLREVS